MVSKVQIKDGSWNNEHHPVGMESLYMIFRIDLLRVLLAPGITNFVAEIICIEEEKNGGIVEVADDWLAEEIQNGRSAASRSLQDE